MEAAGVAPDTVKVKIEIDAEPHSMPQQCKAESYATLNSVNDAGLVQIKLERDYNVNTNIITEKSENNIIKKEKKENIDDEIQNSENSEDQHIWIKIEPIEYDKQLHTDDEIKGMKSDPLKNPMLSVPGVPNVQPLPSALELERAEARRIILEKQMFACDECDTRFTFKSSLSRHKKKFHSSDEKVEPSSDSHDTGDSIQIDSPKVRRLNKQFQCNLCNKKLSSTSTLRSHVMTYHGPAFTCQVCSKPFYLESDFKKHSHDTEKPFVCDMCDKRFLYEMWLERHKVVVHTKPFACEVCGKRFSKNCLLIRHKPVHISEKLFHCDVCPKSFRQKFSLTQHRKMHTGEFQYHCELCDRKFFSQIQMNAHIKSHKEKQFQCDICDKKFRIQSQLEYHKPVHYGDKAFACESCGERFSEKMAWLNHMTHHDSNKKYQCDLCFKRFSRKFSLIAHIKNIHFKEKPFPCEICGKRFALKKHYQRHCKTHIMIATTSTDVTNSLSENSV